MSGAGQAQCLRALAGTDVQDPQPLPDREAARDLLVQLPGDQLLADGVAQPAEPVQPRRSGSGEPGDGITGPAGGRAAGRAEEIRTQGRSPRLACGLGSRSRRIWSVRIRP